MPDLAPTPTLQVSRDCAYWEKKVLENSAGNMIPSLSRYLGVSEAAAKIHLFQYLTNYIDQTLTIAPSKAKANFLAGIVTGWVMSLFRTVRACPANPVHDAAVLVIRGDSPVELRSCAEILATQSSVVAGQMDIIGMRDLLKGNPSPTTATVGWGIGLVSSLSAIPHLFRCARIGLRLCGQLQTPVATWRRFGIALAPVLPVYVRESRRFFSDSKIEKIWITSYTSTCSLLADSARERGGMESITVMHGVPLLPFSARTTTDILTTEFVSDCAVLAVYGFCREVRAQRDLRKSILEAIGNRAKSLEVPTWNRIGYGTNLFLALGAYAGTDDLMMARLRIPDGERCAAIVEEFLGRHPIKEALVKIHPREDPNSYEPILQRWRDRGVASRFVDRDAVFGARDCLHVAHLSTLALDLMAAGERVAFFRLSFAQDEENTLGALAKALCFTNVAELDRIATMPECEYWGLALEVLDRLSPRGSV